MPYWQLYYHLVWATRNREPLVTAGLEPELHAYLRGKGVALNGIVHAVGGVADHVHLAVSIPPRVAVADFVGQFKGSSAHWVNHVAGYPGHFGWQEGYGVFSFSKRGLAAVVRYLLEQRRRHEQGKLLPALERIEAE